MKIRIKKRPIEREIDGVSLVGMLPGAVRDVSAVLGAWLIAEGYADSEMRRSTPVDPEFDGFFSAGASRAKSRERRAQKR